MPKPRELTELPFSAYLTAPHGEPVQGGDYDTVHFEDSSFADVSAGNSRFSECAFSAVDFAGGKFRRARFNDIWINASQMVNTDFAEATWLDTEIVTSAMAATALFDAELSRVNFFGCKLVSVNLRGAKLRDVAFVDCALRDVDFGNTTLTGVTFPGSHVEGALFDKATMKKVDLRGTAVLSIHSGFNSLKGAIVSDAQLMELAPALAQSIGLVVKRN